MNETLLRQLALGCMPIAERFYAHAQWLEDNGFTSHRCIAEAATILCTPAEIAESKLIYLEEAKEIICSYGYEPRPIHGCSTGYKSPLLERLRAERLAMGRDEDWFFENSGSPDYYLNPLSRVMENERRARTEKWQKYKELHSSLFEAERRKEREVMNRLGVSTDSLATAVVSLTKILDLDLDLIDSRSFYTVLRRTLSKTAYLYVISTNDSNSIETQIIFTSRTYKNFRHFMKTELYSFFEFRLYYSSPSFGNAYKFYGKDPADIPLFLAAYFYLLKAEWDFICGLSVGFGEQLGAT